MDDKLVVSTAPHLKSRIKTKNIMLDVIIALIPALIAAVIIFGFRALLLVFIIVTTCVLSEYTYRKLMKRKNTISDLSAVVTGILLAFAIPVSLPIWMAVVGGVIAIVLIKQMFGGIGHNFVNPALTARAILLISFPVAMALWTPPFANQTQGGTVVETTTDATGAATPLSILNEESTEALPSYLDLFLGRTPGSLGEVSTFALILGGIYLIFKKIITPTIPLIFIGTVFIFSALLGHDPFIHLLSGGLFLGAIFMATDYITSPLTDRGKAIYAFGCGFLTIIIRIFGDLPEGVSFAIIVMNILVPYIERITMPKAFSLEEAKK